MTQNPRITLTSVHDQWIEGLNQYAGFNLHTALTTFKRLLRTLRASTDEPSARTDDEDGGPDPMPYQILLPEEVALLYINIALIHGYLGSYYLTAAAFEEALLLDEASSIALFGLGIARFYLRELGASMRAFKKCLASFAAVDEQGQKYYRNELTYQVWSGQPELEKSCGIIEGGGHQPGNASDPYRALKSVLVTDFPDGQWTLERARVEWNWRIALFERNYVRKGTERPGGGRWGLNGIPAGVIFDLEIRARSSVDRMSQMTDNSSTTKSNEGVIATVPLPIKEAKSDSGSLVKKKWAALQHKILRKKSSAATTPSPLLLSATSSNSTTSSICSIEGSAISSNNNSSINEMAMVDGRCGAYYYPGDGRDSMPLMSSSATHYHPIFNPYGEDTDAAQISPFSSMSSQQANMAANAAAAAISTFPTTRRSLLLPQTPTTRASSVPGRGRRSSRGSKVMVNTMMQNIGSIKEEAEEEGEEEIGDLWLGRHHARGKEDPGTTIQGTDGIYELEEEDENSDLDRGDNRPRTAGTPRDNLLGISEYGWHRRPSEGGDSPNISPLTRKSDYAIAANSMQDTTLEPTLPATTYVPPPTTTNSHWGSDSYTTDGISPLSSQMRCAIFPSLSSAHQSHHPSYATTDGWDAHSSPENLDYNRSPSQSSRRPSSTTEFSNPANSEAYDRLNCHRPVSAITVTPATPPSSDNLEPIATASDRNSLVDSYYYTSHSRSTSCSYSYANDNPQLSYTGGFITESENADGGYLAVSPRSRYPSSVIVEDEIAVEPLRMAKKERRRERMSITGRTCLGEWEWEEDYKKWMEGMEEEESEEENEMVGEMLKPVRFEGF
ncbi:MAG: hypothetical protein Q9179_006434 [Wetmoreana sp. 5 TL-2023]